MKKKSPPHGEKATHMEKKLPHIDKKAPHKEKKDSPHGENHFFHGRGEHQL